MAALLLLLLPALALAKIDVQLSGEASDASKLKLAYYGNEVDVISDAEIESFKLTDNNLKAGAEAYFGRWPSDSYIRSPTPHGDLYKSYGWTPVLRTLVPKNGRIVSISDEPTIVKQQIFENNSSFPGTYNVGISQELSNSYSTSWTKGGELSVGQEISYEFDLETVSGGGKTSFSISSLWGETTAKSVETTVGSSTALEMELQPGQAVIAQLQATKGTLRIEMDYEASLSGANAVNYDEEYKGHHFWSLDIRAVMNGAGLKNLVKSKQIIEISFYSNAYVTVSDLDMKSIFLKQMF